ncbi:MAG: cyanophycin synthetase, partial [Pseudomonadota bacterium]|nr:cyanophycin synthetase [Pseudomonadota bacterium]
HTPDALRAVLSALRQHTGQSQKVWYVFGCGGDRDRGKRPQMAEIAEQNADAVVITSDNPRSENAQQIIEDIKAGLVDASRANVIEDRASAIGYAIANAAAGDIVLLAGKGHEDYQLIGEEKLPFSDFRCAEMALKKRAGGVCD